MVVDARSERIEDVVELVADVVFGGGTVIFPHDTSYGIGCDPYHLDAVDRVYHAKGRPDQRPLTLQVASPAEFLEYARENALAILAAKRLLPGPITLVVRRPGFLSGELSAGLSTIGFRVPDAVLARAILDRCGPLAMSSANASGDPPYRGECGDRSRLPSAELLVEFGPTPYDVESSVVDLTGSRAVLVREGAVSYDFLCERLGPVERQTVKVRTQR